MRISIRFAAVLAALLILFATPMTSLAKGQTTATCTKQKTHSLPGNASGAIFSFGVQGGNMRPWSVKFALDGTITSTLSSSKAKLTDPKNSLRGLLALADAEGFFAIKKDVGCLSGPTNPDVGNRYIIIHSSSGTKHVNEYGTCTATARFDQLYAVLQETAGTGS